MREIKIGFLKRTSVKLYQSIEEMPIELYNLFNEFGLKDAEIGNNMADIDAKYKNLATFIVSKQNEKALQELNNLYQTHWSIINKINYQSLQFGCMVYSINDEVITDYSEDNLTALLKNLSSKGLRLKDVREEVINLKKNFSYSLN